jgi:hypothetical protein
LRKPVGHFLTPVSCGDEFGRFRERRNVLAAFCTLATMFRL